MTTQTKTALKALMERAAVNISSGDKDAREREAWQALACLAVNALPRTVALLERAADVIDRYASGGPPEQHPTAADIRALLADLEKEARG